MKTHHMHLHSEPFRLIESDEKTVECRLNDEKRQQMSVGDTIVFTLRDSTPPTTLELTISGLRRYETFDELFEDFPSERGDSAWPLQYWTEEEIATHGVLAIELAK